MVVKQSPVVQRCQLGVNLHRFDDPVDADEVLGTSARRGLKAQRRLTFGVLASADVRLWATDL